MKAQLQSNSAYPTPYKLAGVGAQVPNFAGIPNTSISEYLQTIAPTPAMSMSSLNLPALNPAGLAFAGGVPLAPTIDSSTGSTSGLNIDWMNPSSEGIVGNPLGLKLGAEAGGGLPKIAMTDKINTGVGLFNSALGAISAYKALKLGKENLAFQKESFNRNFAAMKGTTNAEMEDRQARRVRYDAQNGLNNNLSVSEYMAKFGVK